MAVARPLTAPVLTLNLTEVAPWGTVTLEGTLAVLALELERENVTPPAPAAALSLMVPVPDWPLTITLGLTAMPKINDVVSAGGGVIVTAEVALTPE